MVLVSFLRPKAGRLLRNGANLVELGKANGFNFSQEELQNVINELNSADADLSDFELSMISASFYNTCKDNNV